MLFNPNLKVALKAFVFSGLLSSQAFALPFHCQSEVLTFLDNSSIEISAQMPTPMSLDHITFQLGHETSSALNIPGPILGIKSRSQKNPNMIRFDISDAKSDDIELYIPAVPNTPAFTGLIRVSFDGGYPLEKKMFCNFAQK